MWGTYLPYLGFRQRYRETPTSDPAMDVKYPDKTCDLEWVSDTLEFEWLGFTLLIHVSGKATCVSSDPKAAVEKVIKSMEDGNSKT